MKISAIFSDYDGTLAPGDVPLEHSSVPKEIADPLHRLSTSVPVAIVTSKDHGFIRPRTGFASAWACVSGLEIVLSDGRTFPTPLATSRIREGLEYVKRHNDFALKLELKRNTTGDLLAFSMDWRAMSAPPDDFISSAKEELTRIGLKVAYDHTQPFIDVFGATPDKGRAVKELRRLLEVSGNVLFLGDSIADNAAFDEAEVAVCVAHGQELGELSCRFAVRYDELGSLLRSLADDALSLDLHTLRRK